MDIEYLLDHIKEELCDSKDYAKKALELKPMTEAWSKKFYEMSVEEHKHATNFYQMFNEYCSKMSTSFTDFPDYVKEFREEVVDTYTKYTTTIKTMWELLK